MPQQEPNTIRFTVRKYQHFVSPTSRCALAFSLLLILTSVGCKKKIERQGKVIGSSMAPHFLGEHDEANCSNCAFEFPCDLEQAQDQERLVCPNCGSQFSAEHKTRIAASLVKLEFNPKQIDRWDVIAFQLPQSADIGIKRVVGLSGEMIEIRNGNLLANGSLMRKTLSQQKKTRIAVFDSNFRGPNGKHFLPTSNQWTIGDEFVFSGSNQDDIHWLGFQPSRNYAHRDTLKNDRFPIEDSYGFNQSLSRKLNRTDELFLTMDVKTTGASVLAWKFDHRDAVYLFHLDVPDQSLTISSSESEFESVDVWIEGKEFAKPTVKVEFSTIDQQLGVWINGNEYFHNLLPERESAISQTPIDIGAVDGNLTVDRIRIWRDLYYSPQGPGGVEGESVFQSSSGLIVLGDNVPLSVDSRSWDDPRLKESNVVGKVISY
jgi:DNA-directed RNA polymerase subunit RPC12/RpoP